MTGFWCLGALDSTSALHLGRILNSKITKQKQKKKKVKNMRLNRLQKNILVYSMRAEIRGGSFLDQS